MVSVKVLVGAVAATVIGTAAFAADMPAPPPVYQPPVYQPPQPVYQPPIVYQPPAAVLETLPIGSWYLRGDVGVGLLNFSEFDHSQTNAAFAWPPSWMIVQKDIQDTMIAGIGVGYEVNNWLRLDVTGEYRSKSMFKVTGSYTNFCPNSGVCFDVDQGNYSAAVLMANVYLDLGTWWCLTPYVGVGLGGAWNRISGIQDVGIIADGSVGFGLSNQDISQVNLAWNVQAGLSYNVTNNVKLDLSWRFLNLGSPQTAIVFCQNTSPCPGAYYTFKDMTSQDFRVGFRWLLQPEPAPVAMPQPVYQPAPQPPLMSRG